MKGPGLSAEILRQLSPLRQFSLRAHPLGAGCPLERHRVAAV
jgi:hypothetical protein